MKIAKTKGKGDGKGKGEKKGMGNGEDRDRSTATVRSPGPGERVLVCPQCHGTDIYYETGLMTGYKYHCKTCDYIGAFIIQPDILEEGNDGPKPKKDALK
jgi:hypothetical protein